MRDVLRPAAHVHEHVDAAVGRDVALHPADLVARALARRLSLLLQTAEERRGELLERGGARLETHAETVDSSVGDEKRSGRWILGTDCCQRSASRDKWGS